MSDYLSIAFLLFGLGVVLFLAEYFLPTGGFLLVGGTLVCAAGVAVIALYGEPVEAVAALVVLCVGVPLGGSVMISVWGKRMAAKHGPAEETRPAVVSDLEPLRGRFGRTLSPMRPAGTVEIDGRRVDALTEGVMLEANVWVKCIDVRAGTVVVRQVPAPRDLADFDPADLN